MTIMSESLSNLSTEILLHIFSFCGINELCRLKQTCSRFNKIIEHYIDQILSYPTLVTNQQQFYIKERSQVLLSGFEKWKVAYNWKIGRYHEKAFLYEYMNFIPWLSLSKTNVWISRGPYIKVYRRHNNKIDAQHPLYILASENLSELSRFVRKDHCIVCGQYDGAVWIWSKAENKITTSREKHDKEVLSVDIHNDVVVSGSRDCTLKLWICRNNLTEIELKKTCEIGDRIWSVSINESGSKFAVGTSGHGNDAALKIYDMNVVENICGLGENFQKGAGILDIQWMTDNIIVACGYDSCVRKWDLRTGSCVQSWDDPFQATVYCLDSDKSCTLLTGTHRDGRVVLFDMRQTKYVQMYFMHTCRRRSRSSPVYSLSFDATQLFVATDQHLNVLDFTDGRAKIQNYTNLFLKEVTVSL